MKPTKGLGTGLGALFGNAANSGGGASDFEYLPIQRIEPRPEQPRMVFEQEKIDELAESIREHGVLSPLTVRYLDDGYYQIITGERRWRAARSAGLAEVPARVIVADDRKALELAMVENLQREDLNPIEEARGYKSLMDEFGLTQDDISQRVSKSRPAVANSLRLLSLPVDLVELVGSGDLSAGSARALLGLKNEDKMQNAARLAVDNDLSVREVETLVRRLNSELPKQDPPSENEVDYLQEVQNQLTAALGRRVTLRQGKVKEKGKIEIEYYSQDDLNALFDVLTSIKL